MMMNKNPILSIGLPVYEGERYLRETMDSALSQTFDDFELIISDNASTDRTDELCKEYARMDKRIRYYRNKENLGGSWNHNRVVELSRAKYFKWMSHDDIISPEFLEKCLDVLEMDSSVILCYPRSKAIDEHGVIFQSFPAKPNLNSPKPYVRLYECICVPHPQNPVFGVVRSDILKKTRLLDNYSSSDRTLLGELTLRGKFFEIPEFLFFKRYHPEQSFRQFPTRHAYQEWFDPRKTEKISFPHWRLLFEHFISITRVPLNMRDRILCYACLVWWIRLNYRNLALNLVLREKK